jgi:Tol biopolymer transport system component
MIHLTPSDELLHEALSVDGAALPEDLAQSVRAAVAATPRGRWLQALQSLQQTVPVIAVIAMLLLLAAVAIGLVGSQRRLPPPFGLAANGRIAYVSSGRVYTADETGSTATALTDAGLAELTPMFSRDGARIAFKRLVLGEPADDPRLVTDLVVMAADGSHEVVVDAGTRGLSAISWSPDGQSLLYSREVRGRQLIFVAAADGSGVRQVGDLPGDAWSPGWSPDGRQIVVAIDDRSIAVLDRFGSETRTVTHATYAEIGHVEWSPDGLRILFSASTSADDGGHVYVVGLDGTSEHEIAPSGLAQAEATWSPDGSRIAFLRAAPPSGPRVVIADAAGRVMRVLPGNYGWFTPTWSPDGTRLAISDDRPGPENVAGPLVIAILDPIGDEPPTTLEPLPDASLGTEAAGLTWQRLAP